MSFFNHIPMWLVFATQRFSERRHLVIDEANAIGTTYLRAGLLPAPKSDEVREILRKYVALRLKLHDDLEVRYDEEKVDKALVDSGNLQTELWNLVKLCKEEKDSPSTALFQATVNETIDLQSKRLYAERYGKLPDIVWFVLYGLTFLGMVGAGKGHYRTWQNKLEQLNKFCSKPRGQLSCP